MKYCKKCVMPDTKPDFFLDSEGVCCACRNYENRKEIDWNLRKEQFLNIIAKHRSKHNWDCIVPVSGGKDSTYQVLKMLQLGVNPLCVTATTCHLTEIGRKNIENIKSLGVDYIEFSPNPIIRKKLNRIGLRQVGDISWPEHVGIFTIPVRFAVQLQIPLLIWGECSQNEYGGPSNASQNNNIQDRRWMEEFGGLLGLRVSDLVGFDGITLSDLLPYTYPDESLINNLGIKGFYLGYYFPWDGYSNALISQANGFTTYDKTVEGSIVNYENLDNYQVGIHDYFKFLKFGFSRATDIACMHLRRGRISRADAIDIVRKHDGKFPWTYLGKPLEEILAHIEVTLDEFIKICDQFTNKKLFVTDSKGNLVKDKYGNLTKITYPDKEDSIFIERVNESISCRL